MKNDPNRSVESIFHESHSRAPGAERQAYLDGACAGDSNLRARVEALLAAHEEANDFLEDPAVSSPQEGPGTSIGPYKLLQQIGEGGMGVVYMAEQEKPVRRKVALKVIKLGMDTKQVIARFEAERQALAMMDHAHIARVLDAGATETGRPYFVMELVRGVPINEYCDTHKVSTKARLGLFVDVCRAVQHAHQKGVIHRDLKPTNVLITSHDGVPVPKIIDFGVAKATNQRLTESTLFTEFHQIIGTPEYMSPEQAEMSGLDVDTRSDIYSLGVLLYQLLTGTTPVDPKELRTAAYEEMTRMIREDEAPAPSTRMSKLGLKAEAFAKQQSSDANTLSRQFRGDLDWIVMKALEKDRTRRYETAAAFAEDVVRHLENQPVVAGPPGAGYRITKFARRNRKAVAAGLIFLLVIGLGLAGTTAGFLSARKEAQRSGRINASLKNVLAMTDPGRAADRTEVEKLLANVRDVFGEDHVTFAAVQDTLALRLYDAGDFDSATRLNRESLENWKRIYGEKHPNVAITLARLGSSLRAQGEDEEAESALRAALDIHADGDTPPGTSGFTARVELADLLSNRGAYAEADQLLSECLEILRASPSPAHFRIIETLERRLYLQINQPAADPLATLHEIYTETHEFYPDDSPVLAIAALGYGKQLCQQGQFDAGEPYLREALTRFQASPNPPVMYQFAASDALFQVIRSREDEQSIAETDALLGSIIELGKSFLSADQLAVNQKYYANRLYERGRHRDALDAVMDAHQALVDAGHSFEERENMRDNLVKMAMQCTVPPGLSPAVYANARKAVERALQDEPEHPAMVAVRAAVLYRLGEYDLAAELLDLPKPLSEYTGGLARAVSPADHAFGAMAHARLGNRPQALEALEALRANFALNDGGKRGRAILSEVEAVVESMPAAATDDR